MMFDPGEKEETLWMKDLLREVWRNDRQKSKISKVSIDVNFWVPARLMFDKGVEGAETLGVKDWLGERWGQSG